MPILSRYSQLFPTRSIGTSTNGTTTTAVNLSTIAIGTITFGGTGAVASYSLPTGAAVARSATGTYDFTGLPQGTRGIALAFPIQALATATQWRVTAFDAAAGTATLRHSAAGANADPASADSVQLVFITEGRS